MQQMSLVGSLDPGCKARSHDFAIFLLMERNLFINMIMKITVFGNPSEQVMWSRPVDAASRRNTHYIRCLTVLATLRHRLGIVKIPNHRIEYNLLVTRYTSILPFRSLFKVMWPLQNGSSAVSSSGPGFTSSSCEVDAS